MSITKGMRACLVWNNYPENWIEVFEKYYQEGKVQYMCGGEEVAPTTGTPHIQGYVSWKNETRFARLAKKLRCAFIMAHGNDHENRAYCSKTRPGDTPNKVFREWGTPKVTPQEGGRAGGEAEKRRWEDARQAAKEGRMDDIPADIYVRYCKNLEWIRAQNEPVPKDLDGELKHVWIHGPAGVGKSRVARILSGGNFYSKNLNKWWDGYKGQPFVVIDEVSTKNAEWMGDLLKIWADRYAFNSETKGSSRVIRPICIIVTSNYSINDLWSPAQDVALNEALVRRFHQVHMLAPGGMKWTEENLKTEADKWAQIWGLEEYRNFKVKEQPSKAKIQEEFPREQGSEDEIDFLLNLDN